AGLKPGLPLTGFYNRGPWISASRDAWPWWRRPRRAWAGRWPRRSARRGAACRSPRAAWKRAPTPGVLAMTCDVTRPDDLQRWFDATITHFGQVDILVTNTGGPPAAPFVNLSDEQWQAGVDGTLMNVI